MAVALDFDESDFEVDLDDDDRDSYSGKDDILIVNSAGTDDGEDAMSVAPWSDSPSLTVRDGIDEGKHNSVTPMFN